MRFRLKKQTEAPAQEQCPYSLGLALSGGSVKGFAHIGVLKYLEEHQIKPEIIAGTSAGSIIGAFYADGYQPEEIFEILQNNMSFWNMTNLSLKGGGFFSIDSFVDLLKKNLRHNKIEDLPLPLRIVATNIDEGCQHIFTQGPLVEAVAASCSIPVLFSPMEIDGVHFVDGGLLRNFPVTVIRKDCDRLIGVNLNPDREDGYNASLMGVAQRTWSLVFRQNANYDRKYCDVLLETPEVTRYSMFEVSSAREIMDLGYDMAVQAFEHAKK